MGPITFLNSNRRSKLKSMFTFFETWSLIQGTKFTIGTSDESEDDTNDEDLQKLFCPRTDSNGSPYTVAGTADDHLDIGYTGEQMSAQSCRAVSAGYG